tara:strand:+ start:3802 stop:3975 length:174 start_codon:yes stop_codon:yes gene_type:complete
MTKEKTKEKGRKWDGRSRIPTKKYKENYDRIFKKKKKVSGYYMDYDGKLQTLYEDER